TATEREKSVAANACPPDVAFCFFFSSRRRHTRSYGDWSSDVCSSDLRRNLGGRLYADVTGYHSRFLRFISTPTIIANPFASPARSEERRVGKECRCRGAPEH